MKEVEFKWSCEVREWVKYHLDKAENADKLPGMNPSSLLTLSNSFKFSISTSKDHVCTITIHMIHFMP